MAFRAKCRITGVHQMSSVTPNPDGTTPVTTVQVTLQPVYGGDDDEANRQWSRWTPSGQLQLSITNPLIFPELVPGRAFFVDFTPIEG
ncbi:MAG: hypothetical protein JNJ54_34980 [Myxococcaceae bacterium]|nr:hypothetical protein [Myxococcaceae bacterium]